MPRPPRVFRWAIERRTACLSALVEDVLKTLVGVFQDEVRPLFNIGDVIVCFCAALRGSDSWRGAATRELLERFEAARPLPLGFLGMAQRRRAFQLDHRRLRPEGPVDQRRLGDFIPGAVRQRLS